MIDLSSALLSVLPATTAPVVVADGAAASSGSFARTLGAFLDAKDAVLEPQTAMPLVPERQGDAEPGKDLPQPVADDADTPDSARIPVWFAPIALSAVTIAPPPASDSAATATAIPQTASPPIGDRPITAPPTHDIAPNVAPEERVKSAIVPQVIPDALPAHDTASIGTPEERVKSAVVPQVTPDTLPAAQALPPKMLDVVPALLQPSPGVAPKPLIAAPRIEPDAKAARAALPLDIAAQAIAVSTLPRPAGQVFASARAIAGSWREQAPRGDDRDAVDVLTSFASTAPIDLRERAIVQAAADTAHTALDLTADTGLQRMIDRIETLRDAADAGDTRVRLIPDALGSIDVAVRQEGDRVHVRFTAEHEATRALIAEAQPRLNDLAAARGVRIGETSVSTGTGGGGGTPPQPRPAPSRVAASVGPEAAILSTTDHRLA